MQVNEYLKRLEEGKLSKNDEIKEAIDIYVGLWKKAISNKIVSPEDDIEEALEKIDRAGGLYNI